MQNKKCSEKVHDKHEWQTEEQAKDKDETEDGTDGETQGTKTTTKNENKRMTQTVKLNHVHPFFLYSHNENVDVPLQWCKIYLTDYSP